jgi:copper homeostasis protein
MPQHILVEICAGSLDDAAQAQAGGADRIELNSSLFQGGLTPSLGTLVEVKQRLTIPVMCMIRPRGGGFCYTDNELAVIERDIELAVEHGAEGIVIGVLKDNGSIDLARTKLLVQRARGCQTVFHRAFDVTPDPFVALEQLIDLGVTRILTSGQEETVYNGCRLIRELIERADGRIEILPGGGIDAYNLGDVLERTGTNQIHLALLKQYTDPSTLGRSHIYYGGHLRPAEEHFEMIDGQAVRAIREAFAALGPMEE